MSERLGPYELVRLLGRGGMGEVHLARDTRLQRDVALKLLPPELADDPERRARFLREARAAAALSHPHITTVLDVGEAEGRDYIAQELLEGRPLSEILAERRLPLEELVELSLPLADALAYAHEQGVIHRDLKPANVIVTSRGHAKLLDFGLAKVIKEGDAAASEAASTTLTLSGAVFGTPSAMSPEQALGQVVDARSDVFSFGALLHEMASGRPAFAGTTIQETINKVVNAEPEPLGRLRRDLPEGFVRIVERALRKDPAARYPSMGDLSADLSHLRRQTESGLVPPAKGPGGRRPSAGLLALLVVVATLGAAGAWWIDAGRGGAGDPGPVQSVAVLPLANMGGGAEDEYFSDGMSEAILTALTRVDGLKVAARTSSFSFRGQDVELAEVGELLGVDHVLEGTVHRAGDQLRLTASLVKVSDGLVVWSERYARTLDDVFALQDEVASAIAAELQLALGGEPLVQAPTHDLVAYDLYLKGRFHWERRGSELELARDFFLQALERDDEFAEAWAGLADSYSLMANWGMALPEDTMPQARAAADRALMLDPELAAAHTALAFILEVYEWDTEAALGHYRRALQLDPDSVQARYWYGLSLALGPGRAEEAMEQFAAARALDPLALLPLSFQGMACLMLRRFDEAEALLSQAIERHPRSAVPRLYLTWLLISQERWEEADQMVTRCNELDPEVGWRELAYVRARRGDPTLARQRHAELKAMGPGAPGHNVLIPLALGLREEALEMVEALAARRDDLRMLKYPRYDSLRDEPRFRAVMALYEGGGEGS